MLLKEVLDKTVQFFRDKGIETPRLDAELLFCEALSLPQRVDIYLRYDQPLKDDELNKCRDFVRRRAGGEPLAYIIGKKYFYGRPFIVGPGVLIPRPETELLAEQVILWTKKNFSGSMGKVMRILDIGFGSGCLGLTLLAEIPDSTLVAVEKSQDAAKIAKQNMEELGLSSRTELFVMDVMTADFKKHEFDVIVANPPYISESDLEVHDEVKKFEPHAALFSAHEGMQDLKDWSEKASLWLKSPGMIGFEMGYKQQAVMENHFGRLGFDNIRTIKDLAGHPRHIIGERN